MLNSERISITPTTKPFRRVERSEDLQENYVTLKMKRRGNQPLKETTEAITCRLD
jgi:hypothetical protein